MAVERAGIAEANLRPEPIQRDPWPSTRFSRWCEMILRTYIRLAAQIKEPIMLWTVFVVLLVLWLLGLVSSYTLGGFIHILLVLALVVLVINLVSGRRTAI